MTKSRNKGQTVGGKYSGTTFLQTPGRTQTSGSPFYERSGSSVTGIPVSVPGTASSSKKRQIADKENLPYFRIYKTSIYSNQPIDDNIRGTQTLEQGIDSFTLEG
ncbi:hypothetical protein DY000_02017312 [Brassica cretica]|uniref:Uncharacterized protein n=1 Tax=Brassica cretica TaxID=69181 RepID=A0ABQ7CY35_BRACR|nr:hypothetical protein DY000_02017312 [Brassica cretica]